MAKKVSAKNLRAWLKGYNDTSKTITAAAEHNGVLIPFNVRTNLTLDEQSTFVRRVAESCFDTRGNYRPEYYMHMFAATAVQMLTDLPALGVNGADDELDIYAMSNVFWECGILNIDDEDLKNTIKELMAFCEGAITWRQKRILAEDANKEIDNVTRSIREFVDALARQANEVDTGELLKYAAGLAKRTEKLDPEELARGVIEFGVKKAELEGK